jgi:hypothetical protein
MRNLIRSCLALLALTICGCMNPYAKFYRDLTNGVDISSHPNMEISSAPPRLVHTGNHDETAMQLREEGYHAIGLSSFWAKDYSETKAIEQAEHVKASVVLFSKKYRNSESGSVPLTLPTTQTSYNSFSGNVYGTGGSANYYGSGSTTTYGTQTTYLPYTNHYYDYMVSYWVKQKNFRFGIEPKELSETDKVALQSNKGVRVDLVVKNTPAYEADILKGDFIKQIAEDPILDTKSFFKAIDKHEGTTVKIMLIRNGQEITKEVSISKGVR